MKVRFLKVCGSKLDNTKKILMSKNSTPIFFFNFHFPVTVGLVSYLQIFFSNFPESQNDNLLSHTRGGHIEI